MYDYQTQRPGLFTENCQVLLLAMRDAVQRLIRTAGAARVNEIFANCPRGFDTWQALACLDRLVELDETAGADRTQCGRATSRLRGRSEMELSA